MELIVKPVLALTTLAAAFSLATGPAFANGSAPAPSVNFHSSVYNQQMQHQDQLQQQQQLQKQQQAATAAGGSTGPVTVHIDGAKIPNTTPSLGAIYAPASANCRIGIGAQGVGPGIGFGFSGSTLDEGCDTREDVRLLVNMDRTAAAVRRACQKPELAKALGAECAAPQKDASISVIAPPPEVVSRNAEPVASIWANQL
jgi:hypothetical protein